MSKTPRGRGTRSTSSLWLERNSCSLNRPPWPIGGFSFGASTGASDPVRHVGYAANVRYRSDIDGWDGGLSVTVNKLLPVFTLTADSVLMAISRFLARNPRPKQFISDNGTNFVRGDVLIRNALAELDKDKFTAKHPDILWTFNPPLAA